MAEIVVVFQRLADPVPGPVSIVFGIPSEGTITGNGAFAGVGEKPIVLMKEGTGLLSARTGLLRGVGVSPFVFMNDGTGLLSARGAILGQGRALRYGTGYVTGGGQVGDAPREPSGPGLGLIGEGLDPELGEQDEDTEGPFLPAVFENHYWSTTLTFDGYVDTAYANPILNATVVFHPNLPGITIEQLDATTIRISGTYTDLFDESYDYMVRYNEFITKTNRERDPAWYLVGWTPPTIHEITLHYIIEISGLIGSDQLTFPQTVYWSDTISLSELDNIIRKVT